MATYRTHATGSLTHTPIIHMLMRTSAHALYRHNDRGMILTDVLIPRGSLKESILNPGAPITPPRPLHPNLRQPRSEVALAVTQDEGRYATLDGSIVHHHLTERRTNTGTD